MAQVTLLDSLGGVELKAKLADMATTATSANKATRDDNNSVISSTYAKTGDVQRYSAYSGGNGIVVTGTGLDAKTISSNMVELPVHSGTGIKVELDANQEYAIIRCLPEVFLYNSSNPFPNISTNIIIDATSTATVWDSLGQDANISLDANNTGVTGLNASKLYRCTAQFNVNNTSGTTADITISASASFATGVTETVLQSISGTNDSIRMNWYVKGATGITFSATGLSSTVTTGLADLSICEVCDV